MKKDQFERAKASADHGILVHLVCNEADGVFYSEDPEGLSEAHRTVLCVETFFGAVCDGGIAAWFDLDHGALAHCAPAALRRVGLPKYAELAEQALRFHLEGAVPANGEEWPQHLERIRQNQAEEDLSEVYEALDTEFFALCQAQPNEFRDRLFEYIVQHEAELVEQTSGG